MAPKRNNPGPQRVKYSHMHGDTYHQRRNERHDGERALDDV